MKGLVKIAILSLLLISCNRTDNEDGKVILTYNLKELPKVSEVKLSELGFIDISYIPLETNEQSVIEQIGEVKIGNEFFLVKSFNSILLFMNDGSFVTKIGTTGKGPNEFQVAHDLNVDKRNQTIYLVSGWQSRFFVYSAGGELLRTFKIPLYAAISFRFTGQGDMLCYSDNYLGNIESSFVIMDTSGNIIKYFPNQFPFKKHPKYTSGYQHENLFYQFNDQLYKKEMYSDTVYIYKNLDFRPHLVIEVGDRLVTPQARSEFDRIYLASNYITPLNLFEFGDYLYYEFMYELTFGTETIIYGFFGSKKDDYQVLINSEQGLINDLDGGPNIWPKTTLDDKTIIGWIDVIKLKEHITSETFKKSNPKYPEKKKELEQLANSLKETDNPVLVMVRLKE